LLLLLLLAFSHRQFSVAEHCQWKKPQKIEQQVNKDSLDGEAS